MTDTTEPQPVRKSSLPCTPPPEFEFHTWFPLPDGGGDLVPGQRDRGVHVRRLVTYGDWEPVHPGRWADEPESDAAPVVVPAADRAAVLREAAAECDKAGGVYGQRGANDAAGAAFALMETFLRKADEAEYVAAPCSVGGCEPGGEPCSTHERLMAHAEGDHELCAPDCGAVVDRVAAETPQPETDPSLLDELQRHLDEHTPSCNARTDHLMRRAAWALGAPRPAHIGGNAEDCPGCEGTNPPYPFLCPGPAVVAQPGKDTETWHRTGGFDQHDDYRTDSPS